MKKKNSARDNLNLFFSAFLIVAYIVCAYFFMNFANTMQGVVKPVITALVFVVFGLLVFYATRVGDGKSVKRFSLITFLLLDLPCVYAIVASMVQVLPLNEFLVANPTIVYMAAVALGYGIPYTFLSGFEIVEGVVEAVEETQETESAFEDLADATEETEVEEAQETEDEVVVEGVEFAEEATEEATEEAEEETAE